MTIDWYEVWASDSSEPPYILVLCNTTTGYRVVDPQEKNRVVFADSSLEKVRNFLLEDEFTMVDGRMDWGELDE